MNRPLTITSTTNTHALATYACVSVLGFVYSTRQPPEALGILIGLEPARFWSLGLLIAALAALASALMAGKMANPASALSAEIITLLGLTPLLGVYVYSLIQAYGLGSIPATLIMASGFFCGCFGRLLQAGWERARLMRAHNHKPATIEVAAEPDR